MNKPNDFKEKWKNTLHKIFRKFAYVMVLFYFVFSLMLLLTNIYSASLLPVQRYSVGGMLFVYASFRAYRIYLSQKKTIDNDE